MGDGDMKTEGVVVINDAPELGAHVELHEGTVGDALQLIDAQQAGVTGIQFVLLALAVSLRINGERRTVEQLKALPVRCTNSLLRIGQQALEVNRFFPKANDDDTADVEPEPPDPKS